MNEHPHTPALTRKAFLKGLGLSAALGVVGLGWVARRSAAAQPAAAATTTVRTLRKPHHAVPYQSLKS